MALQRVFLSYPFGDRNDKDDRDLRLFVNRIAYHLKKQPGLDCYCYCEDVSLDDWPALVGPAVSGADWIVIFLGKIFGKTQTPEVATFRSAHQHQAVKRSVLVLLHGGDLRALPSNLFQHSDPRIDLGGMTNTDAEECARHIYERIIPQQKEEWCPDDGLPIGYPFDYEKGIIEEFCALHGKLDSLWWRQQGCPLDWPNVEKLKTQNPWILKHELQDDVGTFGGESQNVRVVASSGEATKDLTLPEARARKEHIHPRAAIHGVRCLTVAIVVSGGIAPGINSVIAGIVERHRLYYDKVSKGFQLRIFAYRDGFSGLSPGNKQMLLHLIPGVEGHPENENSIRQIQDAADKGGSFIGTSRFEDLIESPDQSRASERIRELDAIIRRLNEDHVDIVYVIGGDGSMRAAHAMATRSKALVKVGTERRDISIVGIPKTMDNDILWVWQSFGFMSAVERAKEAILQLRTEIQSNPRLCVIQLFGSDSGFVVSHAALASGVCDAVLIPEVPFTLRKLADHMCKTLNARQRPGAISSPHGLVVLAETAVPEDVEDYLDNDDYPNLGLDEKEKEALRTFFGSSLLQVSEIRGWNELCGKLKPSGNQSATLRKLWAALPAEIQGLVESASTSMTIAKNASLQSAIVRAINQPLRSADLYDPDDETLLGHEAREAIPLFLGFQNAEHSLDEKALRSLAYALQLPAKSLPSPDDAKRMQKLRAMITHCRPVEFLNRWLMHELVGAKIVPPPRARRAERRVHGQTPDELRRGGRKIVAQVLQAEIRYKLGQQPRPSSEAGDPIADGEHGDDGYALYWKAFRVFTNEPRHLLRAIPPSVPDVVFGHRLGVLAVDNAMAGYTDFMISQWLTEYVLVPLRLVCLGRKRVPRSGNFWRSVVAGTGQPDLSDPTSDAAI